MKLLLPTDYYYKDLAIVEDNILYIHHNGYFHDIMFDLTYTLKDDTMCYYCHNPFSRNRLTLDHMYPLDIGGVTLPINLVPCCMECNSTKGNMTESEFWIYRALPDEKKYKYKQMCIRKKQENKRKLVTQLPEDWIVKDFPFEKISSKYYRRKAPYGKNYQKIVKDYKKYNRIQRPVILDKNFNIINGFNVYSFAKHRRFTYLPAIILDNVILEGY